MTRTKLGFALGLIFLCSCSSDNGSSIEEREPDNNPPPGLPDIELSIEENTILTDSKIEVTIPANVEVDKIKVYLGSQLLAELNNTPYSFEIDTDNFDDGTLVLKIDLLQNEEVYATKSINVRIDNNGPQVNLTGIADGETFCGAVVLSPDISDTVSEISVVDVFVDDVLLSGFTDTSDYSFTLDPEILGLGIKEVKFVMEDEIGNISKDSISIGLSQKLLNINFPAGFVRSDVEKMHVILSNPDGDYLGSATYDSASAETLEVCSQELLEPNETFILTFVTDFQDVVFSFFSYQNLTLENLGTEINLAERAGGLSPASINIDLADYTDGYYVRASGPWSSGFNYGSENVFSGNDSRFFTVERLGSNKMFIMNFNTEIAQSYKYAFVEDPHTIFSLGENDFLSENVVHDFLDVQGTNTDPYLSIFGFENGDHFNGLVSHMLYWNASLNSQTNYDYSYADIFENIFHSIKVSNYSVEGLGHPPASVTVPGDFIDYSYSDNLIDFTGLPDYEVARAQLRNTDDAHIFLEIYFDGQADRAIIPQLPEHLFSANVLDVFTGNRLELNQCVVENYSTLDSYDEYISKVFVPSVPFYTVSPKRERILKSSVSTSLLPMTEFPFYQRF